LTARTSAFDRKIKASGQRVSRFQKTLDMAKGSLLRFAGGFAAVAAIKGMVNASVQLEVQLAKVNTMLSGDSAKIMEAYKVGLQAMAVE
jgi:molybdopterin-binding protein